MIDFTVPKKDLTRLLASCVGVADRKGAMPVLANVLLTADDRLRVAATDLYLAMSGSTEASIAERGSVAVPAKDFFERVKAMPDVPIHVSADKDAKVTIKAVGQKRTYTISGIAGSDFPEIPPPPSSAMSIALTVEAFALLMNRTHFSISPDTTRPMVNSALFECEDTLVRMVSTDGHRLSKQDLASAGVGHASALIPQRAIAELRRLMSEAKTGPLTIRLSSTSAFFDVGGLLFSCKLIDAMFPPYAQVIPKQSDCKVLLPRLGLVDALKAIDIASNDETGGVKLALVPGALRISSDSAENGNAFDELPTDYSGQERRFGVSARYLLEALGTIDSDNVFLALSGELDPCVITAGEAVEGSDFVGVVMPMRL